MPKKSNLSKITTQDLLVNMPDGVESVESVLGVCHTLNRECTMLDFTFTPSGGEPHTVSIPRALIWDKIAHETLRGPTRLSMDVVVVRGAVKGVLRRQSEREMKKTGWEDMMDFAGC
jgi:hypothetical protein